MSDIRPEPPSTSSSILRLLYWPFSYHARLLWRLKRHNKRLVNLLREDCQSEIRRTILLEAALFGHIANSIESLNKEDPDLIFDTTFKDSPEYKDMLKQGWVYAKELFGKMGGSTLLEKIGSLLNKIIGGAG